MPARPSLYPQVGLTVTHETDGCVFGHYRNMLICAWCETPALANLHACYDVAKNLARTHRKFSAMHILLNPQWLPDKAQREVIVSGLRDFATQQISFGALIVGSGYSPNAIRIYFRSLQGPEHTGTKIVLASTIPELVSNVLPRHIRVSGVELVGRHLETACQQAIERLQPNN